VRGAKLGRREYSLGRGILRGVPAHDYEEASMADDGWTYESKYIILTASPDLRERFRAAMRTKLEEEND
jgi:hypothetical protein